VSRLNQADSQRHDVFVLDFMTNAEAITAAFPDHCRTTIFTEEADRTSCRRATTSRGYTMVSVYLEKKLTGRTHPC
jgi:hypothetical protein